MYLCPRHLWVQRTISWWSSIVSGQTLDCFFVESKRCCIWSTLLSVSVWKPPCTEKWTEACFHQSLDSAYVVKPIEKLSFENYCTSKNMVLIDSNKSCSIKVRRNRIYLPLLLRSILPSKCLICPSEFSESPQWMCCGEEWSSCWWSIPSPRWHSAPGNIGQLQDYKY